MREEVLADLYWHRYTTNHNLAAAFLKKEFGGLLQEQVHTELVQMHDDKLISVNLQALNACFDPADKNALMKDFKNNTPEIKILPEGIKEHKENVFREQVKLTNKAVIDSSASAISTDTSIRELNNKTDNYYNQLKWATWVIAIATGLNVFVSLFPYLFRNNDETKLQQIQLEQLQFQQILQSFISLPKIQTTGLVNFFCNLTISNEKANTSKIFAGFQGPGGA